MSQTVEHHPTAHRLIADPEQAPEDGPVLALHDLDRALRERARRLIANAEMVAVLTLEGLKPAEIRQRTGLDAKDYARASEWLKDALRPPELD